ncbi:vWA domain-containing protein [Umezawaea tangerina]|uniref:vWA domain-containing protein n=1 Tax=Umezawaea tangerina TaxID=84725 RepID=UPI001FEB9E95|nr:vWA domain-containing protein [Umezawaea tangerina]
MSTITLVPATAAAPAPAAGKCGPLDVAFVLDDTGSMGGTIANLKTGINSIVNDVVTASGGDYQLGLVTFKDTVTVVDDLAPGNAAAITSHVTNTLAAGGGGGEPEASDEAVNTAVNRLPALGRPQVGDFTGVWRSTATKFVVLVTDARPGGFDDNYVVGADDVNAAARATDALGAGIKISAVYVPTSSAYSSTIVPVMQNYATTTGGVYTQAAADGSGTATAIQRFLSDCRQTDVFMHDQSTDTGIEPNPNGTVWSSPDIKVCPTLADCPGGQPVVGSTSYVHVKLHNPGPYGSGPGLGTLKVYYTAQGGAAVWNPVTGGDWTFIGQQGVTVPAGATVVKIPWVTVPGPGHFCLLARWVSATDPMTFAEVGNTVLNAKNNNNIAWRNVDSVRVKTGQTTGSPFQVGNGTDRTIKTDLVVTSPGKPFVGAGGSLVLDLGPRLFERWRQTGGGGEGVKQVGETSLEITDARQARITGLVVEPGERFETTLVFTGRQRGEFVQHVVQFDETGDIGGVEFQVVVE